MYSSLSNQIFPMLHYLFSFWLLFILLPRRLFRPEYENKLEYWYSGYVKMILLLIISGYILVITKLFEVLSILMMFSLIIIFRYKQKQRKKPVSGTSLPLKRLFDMLDGLFITNPQLMKTRFLFRTKNLCLNIRKKLNWFLVAEGITLVFILGLSSYLRFYDAFVNAAPPLSDSYVTLAWMKYINNRDLFHDGIYPQGFHIYLASIYKFAAVDALYILRYTGPLNTVMITAGLYVVVRKLTNNAIGGLTAAWLYGIVWVMFPFYSTERQAATNSQEFAFVFIFPAIYFFIKFLRTEKKEDLIVGLISSAIIGLVHSIGFALLGLLIGIMIFSSALTLKKHGKPIIQILIGMILTGVLSVLPLGIGYLLGKNLNASSAQYLVSHKNTYYLAYLNKIDFVALGFLFLLLILLFRKKLSREERFLGVFTLLSGVSVFILYYAGGVLTHSTVIKSRSLDLWGLIIPFCVGISVSFLFNMFKGKWKSFIYIITMTSIVTATIIYKPSPIIPYKLEYNENIEQYLRISEKYLPQTWMIVSQDEGYDVALGTGYHMHLGDFLKVYNPNAKTLTKFGESSPDKNIPPHIFVYQEKKVFEVSKTNSVYPILAPKYKQRAHEYMQLTEWMNIHKKAGNNVKIFYQNEHIIVYQLDIASNTNKQE